MQVEQIAASGRGEWNAFAARQPSFGLLQSWEWGEFKERLGWKPLRIAVKQNGDLVAGAQILVKSSVPGLPGVAYIPRGPIGKWLDTEIADRFLPELHQLASSHRAAFLRIEPPLSSEPGFDETLRRHGFKPSCHSRQPRCTIILDLNQDPDALLMQMRKKTRQYIKKAVREGVSVRQGRGEDLTAFYELMRATSRRKRIAHRSREYYDSAWEIFSQQNQTALLMAFHEDELLAARTVYRFGSHAAEFHAGSSDDAATMNPDYLLVWEAMKWAQAQGCSTYDLWGIPNEIGVAPSGEDDIPEPHRTDGMWGVYQFKRGFGTNIVCYVGTYDYVYKPVLYGLTANRFVNTDALDRVAAWLDWL
jgi:lipid II:glycine glycyltransferase (peptidoglycan interpeptide bridge formation enzyme)